MDPEKIFEEAENFFKNGQYQEAERKFTEFVELVASKRQPSDNSDDHPAFRGVDFRFKSLLTQALNNRGQIKYLRVDFDEAVEDYSAALEIDEDFAIGYYNRGQIHYRLGRFQQGIDDFNKALALQPDFPDAVLALKTATEDMQKANTKS
ncbi:tetratricopeptide repeat protein 32-like [Amphiura filiformis]|uniref:tetratricopeptide repeat protein 32-like n=1 Tax=Amphiura filiformis TaxID=82378 RepID=UPI003B225BEA